MSIAVKVENLSKAYQLGEIGTGTISRDIERWVSKLRGREDPFLKIGETNDRTVVSKSNMVWSLKDINFEIEQGDALGIIGRNGAGKSTLLKLLSRVTSPTTGTIKAKGRIASLLEVGTGFHPELTGRENIYLNGAILGMRKKEIERKFDEIVAFSGVERYIDTPVKRYSSGMYVRLAFAVAAHLESEILIVDEVLAVGDAEFQKKCLGKMKSVSEGEGRTVLFVSHNLAAVQQLCSKALVMKNGEAAFDGTVDKGIEYYLNEGNKINEACYFNETPKASDIIGIRVLSEKTGHPSVNFKFDENIVLEFNVRLEQKYRNSILGFRIRDQKEREIFTSQFDMNSLYESAENYTVRAVIPGSILVPNHYFVVVALHIPNVEIISFKESPVDFEIEETGTMFYQYTGNDYGCVFIKCNWQ